MSPASIVRGRGISSVAGGGGAGLHSHSVGGGGGVFLSGGGAVRTLFEEGKT